MDIERLRRVASKLQQNGRTGMVMTLDEILALIGVIDDLIERVAALEVDDA